MQKLIDALNVIKEECKRQEKCKNCPMYCEFENDCIFDIRKVFDIGIKEKPPVIRVVE